MDKRKEKLMNLVKKLHQAKEDTRCAKRDYEEASKDNADIFQANYESCQEREQELIARIRHLQETGVDPEEEKEEVEKAEEDIYHTAPYAQGAMPPYGMMPYYGYSWKPGAPVPPVVDVKPSEDGFLDLNEGRGEEQLTQAFSSDAFRNALSGVLKKELQESFVGKQNNLQKELAEAKAAQKDLQRRFHQEKQKAKEIKQLLASRLQEYDDQHDELESLKKQVHDAQDHMAAYKKDLETAKADGSEKEKDLKKVKRELESVKAKLAALSAKKNTEGWNSDKETAFTSMKEELDATNEELELYKKTVTQMDTDKMRTTDKIFRMNKQIRELTEKNEALKKASDNTGELEAIKTQLKNVRTEKDSYKKQAETAEASIRSLKEQLEQYAANDKSKQFQQQIDELLKKLEAKDRQIAFLKEKGQKSDETSITNNLQESIQKELEALRAENKELEKKAQSQKKELGRLNQKATEVKTSNQQIQELKAKLSERERQITELSSQKSEVSAKRIQELEAQLKNAKEQLTMTSEMPKVSEKDNSDLEDLKRKLASKDKQIALLKQGALEQSDSQKEIDVLKDKIRELETAQNADASAAEVDDLKFEIRKRDNQIQNLNEKVKNLERQLLAKEYPERDEEEESDMD